MEDYENPKLSPEQRADDLIPRMSLREKIGQLTQKLYGFQAYDRNEDEIELSDTFRKEVERYAGLGTIYGLYRADPWSKKDFKTGLDGISAPRTRNRIQKYVIDHSRFGIPVLMSTECPHGHQALDGYLLPVNLASGCTFNPKLLEESVKIPGKQLKEMGVDLALVSCLDILRDPRWGRSEECFGEDPYLASKMAEAVVKGISSQGVDVTAKHLCAQGETTGGVNASAARIGPRELREIHLPPVKACVDAGASSFMAAYNEIDGVFCHGNHALLTDLLRGEYGFRGFVMSDGCAIDQLDCITGDRVASGALALNAGVDMGLWDTGFEKLEEAVARGLVQESRIDEAVRRILIVKFRRGLFEHPYAEESDSWKESGKDHAPQRNLAEESMVLLKNSGNILPLAAEKPMRLALIGPNADAIYNQLGDYTPPVRPGFGTTPKSGIEKFLREHHSPVELVYRRGCPMFEKNPQELKEAVQTAGECDIIVAVFGGSSSRFSAVGDFDSNGAVKKQNEITMDCGEGIDSESLRLPGDQLELLSRLKSTGKPVITVLIAGRPYEMEQINKNSDGIFCCFYPGPAGGEALARILFGAAVPGGRLSVSLPDSACRLPVYYNAKSSYEAMKYYDSQGPVTYGFGSGLNYTDIRMETVKVPQAGSLEISVKITNVGTMAGFAVPQLYTYRMQGIATSRYRLSGFKKVLLQPGESRKLTIPIPEEALQQWDCLGRKVCPPGKIQWFLRDSGVTFAQGEFACNGI